ncbi:TlpA family protein disulfide reductase [Corynebacterium caspium]|uniref:TlpA family protein disulfide reductase n=1 Tax=Corynebacterium caspium TaxID=234828 RepID=UPI00039CE062|nr:TlpA disulfide reductase family protein [Corynebacterium caspium]WKD59895.1 Thiol:disulfide interchange protein TlpA [Corynebacterium caspium DSM 44850]
MLQRRLIQGGCGVLLATAALLLSSCGDNPSEARHNAVAQGGEFQFVSPGGEVTIRYPADERKALPDFSGPALLSDADIHLSDFQQQIVVLNSWGQWCAPCRAEIDDLQNIQEYLQENSLGTVLGINIRDFNPDISRDFVTDNGVTFPSIYDPPFRTAAALGGIPSSVVPTTIILDKQHRPAVVFLRSITADEIISEIEQLSKES